MTAKMEVLLHIGRHGTGTTALQHFFALNAERLLREAGILYPSIGRGHGKNFHHPVFRDVLRHDRPIDPSLVAAILEEAHTRNARRILLSSELLSRKGTNQKKLEIVRDSFGNSDVRIIMYLRRQDTFLQSRYAAMINRGQLCAPARIVDIDVSLDYSLFVRRYESVFGAEAITIRVYEDAIRINIYDDFLVTLGVQDTSSFVMPAARPNRRLPWRYVGLLRLANRRRWQRKLLRHPRAQEFARWLGDHFPGFMDRPEPLNPDERRAIVQRYEAQNAELARRYLQRERLFVVDDQASMIR